MAERWAKEVLKPLLGGQGRLPVQPKHPFSLYFQGLRKWQISSVQPSLKWLPGPLVGAGPGLTLWGSCQDLALFDNLHGFKSMF